MKYRSYCNLCEKTVPPTIYSHIHGMCRDCAVSVGQALPDKYVRYICVICDSSFHYTQFESLLYHFETVHQQPASKLIRPKYRNKLFITQLVKT